MINEYSSCNSRPTVSRIAWNKASASDLEKYRLQIINDNDLTSLQYNHDVLTCRDIHCKTHSDDICNLYESLINVCAKAGQQCIPHVTPSNNASHVPGWNDRGLSSLKNESLSWHHIWLGEGKPREGPVAEMMRITRARYHNALVAPNMRVR